MEEVYRSQFRLPYSLYEQLKASADKSRRSVNAELVARLEESLERESANQQVADRLEAAKLARPVGQSEAAAVLLQGVDELKTKLVEFQRLVDTIPIKE